MPIGWRYQRRTSARASNCCPVWGHGRVCDAGSDIGSGTYRKINFTPEPDIDPDPNSGRSARTSGSA